MTRADDDDPGLPIKLGPCSNAEYVPPLPTPLVREAVRRAREACDENARRSGMSRRAFLRSTAGAATVLAVLAACSREEKRATGSGSEPGGTFEVSPESTIDPGAAQDAIGGQEFIMDVQGHLLEFGDTPPTGDFFGSFFPQAGCGEDDARECFSTAHFLEEVFTRSDTTVAVLSAIPVAGPDGPLTAEVMAAALRQADRLCGEGRVLMQGHAVPSAGPLDAALAAMTDIAGRYPIRAWKVYTHAGAPPFYLDDHDAGAPQVGRAFVEHALSLDIPMIAVHKGFSNGSRFADPVDVGPAAIAHPDANFVIYHSGYEAGGAEGPYTEETRREGVNRLISSVLDAGLGPGDNVYAELGSTWRSVMGSPEQAAHVLGKLLLHLGEDNVIWGTDSIWYGTPQDQIQALRAFQISPELQERFGYPALTPEIKAKVLGGNAARLYGVDTAAALECSPSPEELEEVRKALPSLNVTYGPRTAIQVQQHIDRYGWI